MEKEIKNVISFVKKVQTEFLYLKENTQEQYTKLYWLEIRLMNNKEVFEDRDVALIGGLRSEVEILSLFQEKGMNIIENIQRKAMFMQTILEKETTLEADDYEKIIRQMRSIDVNIRDLEKLYIIYNEEQLAFAQAIRNVELYIKEKKQNKKITLREKIKKVKEILL